MKLPETVVDLKITLFEDIQLSHTLVQIHQTLFVRGVLLYPTTVFFISLWLFPKSHF